MSSTPVRQAVRSKVLTRWSNGTARTTVYAGPLADRLVNTTTQRSRTIDISGVALETDDDTGSIRRYQTFGPVELGMPVGSSSGLPSGIYRLNGYFDIRFDADGNRAVVGKLGQAEDMCAAVR